MLIFERFIFMHMPKTAGIFLSQALRDELSPPEEVLETHVGWDAIPTDARGLPVLMYVRNPWDWYVSWYEFWTRTWLPRQAPAEVRRDPMVRLLFGDGIAFTGDGPRGMNDFPTTVRSACENLDPKNPLMAEMIRDGTPYATAIEPGEDFYTARIKILAGAGRSSDLLTIGRYESLVDDLGTFFVRNEIPVADDLLSRIRARDPVNVNARRPYRAYYDDKLRELVGRSCRELIETFDYRF